MLRINLLVAVAVAASTVGCAICDTCDDFPAPCTGPNCGQPHGVPGQMAAPGMDQVSPVMGTATPAYSPAGDSGGPAPAAPAAAPSADGVPAPAAPLPSTPPAPMDPDAQPK